ncbi:hypothetical protein Ct9H90mP29_13150 [bacterium]|nr:MAG: hypothetical protein Ct9H90mP29_13150 [bacterium]
MPDVQVQLNSNSGNATNVTVTDITTNSGTDLSGGEETIRIHFKF